MNLTDFDIACNLVEISYIEEMTEKYNLQSLDEYEIRDRLFPQQWYDLSAKSKLKILKEALDENILIEDTKLMKKVLYDCHHEFDADKDHKKKYFKTVLIFILFVVFMAGAVILYNRLSDDYSVSEENLTSESETMNDSEQEKVEKEEPQPESEKIEAVDFSFSDIDGNPVKLSDFYGKPIVLNFWATWCGPCKMEMPHFENAYKKYADKVNFLMVNVTDGNRDTPDGVKEFLSGTDYTFPIYLDMGLAGAYTYGAYSIPLSVFITSDGYIHGGQYGALTEKKLENYILEILE